MNRDTAGGDEWTINQIVAYRIAKAREHRGWTQQQAADQLAPFLGRVLSPASFSAIERSFLGGRIRHFDADEIVAMAKGFGLPIVWFFTPPPQPGLTFTTCNGSSLSSGDHLVDLLLGSGEAQSFWQEAVHQLSDVASQAGVLGRIRHNTELRRALGDLTEAQRVVDRLGQLLRLIDGVSIAEGCEGARR